MEPKKITPKLSIFASDRSWIDGNAISQARGTSELEGVEQVVGFPDLHPGKGGPVGIAVQAKVVYPSLIGNDAGCGIGLWQADLLSKHVKLSKWTDKLIDLDMPWDGDREVYAAPWDIDPMLIDESFGTIGGGNHFAELQKVERVESKKWFDWINLDADAIYVCVHSGSRGHGYRLLNDYMAKFQHHGLLGEDANAYIDKQLALVNWADASRSLIADRFFRSIGGKKVKTVCNVCHNFVDRKFNDSYIHRKGAAALDRGCVMIPGSRGAMSYLVMSKAAIEGKDQDINLWSVAHGAGRKWARSDCKDRLFERFSIQSMEQTALGSRVICEDKDLIYEEAPQAYKNIEQVIADLVAAELIEVVAVFRPLITYKVRRD